MYIKEEKGLTGIDIAISIIIITILLSYFTLVFGELVPKRLAMKYCEKFAYFLPLCFVYTEAEA